MKTRNRNLWVTLAVAAILLRALLSVRSSSFTSAAGESLPRSLWEPSDVITGHVYLPYVASNHMNLSVNPQDRQASLDFFNRIYRASEGVPIDWTGDHSTCREGTTSPAFRHAMRLRINYFRAMAGIPGDVALSEEFNQKAQKAALMMSVNRQLSHYPEPTWECYSADGAEAAGRSNLYLGVYAWDAIDGYIRDPGTSNYAVGHRRWILYPQTKLMGTGDIPPADGYLPANALWVIDSNYSTPRPDTREEFVAWPPPGYVPHQVVYPRWSFSYDDADFTAASVSMTSEGQTVPVDLSPVRVGYGENTLVWEPEVDFGYPPTSDAAYTVSVENVIIAGGVRGFVYDVIVFDPGSQYTQSAESSIKGRLGTPIELP